MGLWRNSFEFVTAEGSSIVLSTKKGGGGGGHCLIDRRLQVFLISDRVACLLVLKHIGLGQLFTPNLQ